MVYDSVGTGFNNFTYATFTPEVLWQGADAADEDYATSHPELPNNVKLKVQTTPIPVLRDCVTSVIHEFCSEELNRMSMRTVAAQAGIFLTVLNLIVAKLNSAEVKPQLTNSQVATLETVLVNINFVFAVIDMAIKSLKIEKISKDHLEITINGWIWVAQQWSKDFVEDTTGIYVTGWSDYSDADAAADGAPTMQQIDEAKGVEKRKLFLLRAERKLVLHVASMCCAHVALL